MAVGYTETPHNIAEIIPYVVMDRECLTAEIFTGQACYFYDTCSFRRHANMGTKASKYLLEYVKRHGGIIIMTRTILMELASDSGILNSEYIEYIRFMKMSGVKVLLIYEEDLFAVMEVCFNTNAIINNYLCWAVRAIRGPVSTITEVLEQNTVLYDEVVRGRNTDKGGVFKHFFQEVRKQKAAGDNLGEELLAICLHILSNLPGEEDGKFCIITDDKGTAGKIDMMFMKTAKPYRGKKVVIFSTPKLVQVMHREGILTEKETIRDILHVGTSGNIVVLGTRIYDIRNVEISMGSDELADLILQPNGIQIIF